MISEQDVFGLEEERIVDVEKTSFDDLSSTADARWLWR